ncbi:hypothetical protein E2C01_095428 [Portunus trituberculatus]|uniref:Uncharacterized protein n=1 Tax=Portunus trituberculatus TaxID=210409 RepID=A0A5B7JPT4_PORTR|nr:hypothetical protein [Portunus trituberculatus]
MPCWLQQRQQQHLMIVLTSAPGGRDLLAEVPGCLLMGYLEERKDNYLSYLSSSSSSSSSHLTDCSDVLRCPVMHNLSIKSHLSYIFTLFFPHFDVSFHLYSGYYSQTFPSAIPQHVLKENSTGNPHLTKGYVPKKTLR